jgi:serine/threonine-protein kinase HipA
LNLYGRANRLTGSHLLDAGRRLGLPQRAVAIELDLLCGTAPEWIDRISDIGFDPRTTDLLSQLLARRLRELAG